MGEHELASKQICQQTPCFRRNAGKGKALANRERGTARLEVVVGVTQPLANEQQPRLRLPESREQTRFHVCKLPFEKGT